MAEQQLETSSPPQMRRGWGWLKTPKRLLKLVSSSLFNAGQPPPTPPHPRRGASCSFQPQPYTVGGLGRAGGRVDGLAGRLVGGVEAGFGALVAHEVLVEAVAEQG